MRVLWINPVEYNISGSLMSQLKWCYLLSNIFVTCLSSSKHKQSFVRLTYKLIWLTNDSSSRICVIILFDTLFFSFVYHDVYHVFYIVKTLALKMSYHIGDQFFFCPYEHHTLLHYRYGNIKLPEIFYCDAWWWTYLGIKGDSAGGMSDLICFLQTFRFKNLRSWFKILLLWRALWSCGILVMSSICLHFLCFRIKTMVCPFRIYEDSLYICYFFVHLFFIITPIFIYPIELFYVILFHHFRKKSELCWFVQFFFLFRQFSFLLLFFNIFLNRRRLLFQKGI